jgi:hypothetical protein
MTITVHLFCHGMMFCVHIGRVLKDHIWSNQDISYIIEKCTSSADKVFNTQVKRNIIIPRSTSYPVTIFAFQRKRKEQCDFGRRRKIKIT